MPETENLYEQIKRDATNHRLSIIKETDESILTKDFVENRIIEYHTKPPTWKWLSDRIFWPINNPEIKKKYKGLVINLLLFVDPDMLTTLKAIYFVGDGTDIDRIVRLNKIKIDEFPDTIDPKQSRCMGLFWYSHNSIIININSIETTIQELIESGNSKTNDQSIEFEIALYTTLAHEVRHLGLSNPYGKEKLPESEEDEEKDAELWSVKTISNWIETTFRAESPGTNVIFRKDGALYFGIVKDTMRKDLEPEKPSTSLFVTIGKKSLWLNPDKDKMCRLCDAKTLTYCKNIRTLEKQHKPTQSEDPIAKSVPWCEELNENDLVAVISLTGAMSLDIIASVNCEGTKSITLAAHQKTLFWNDQKKQWIDPSSYRVRIVPATDERIRNIIKNTIKN